MSFREDINSRATKANSIMGIIRRTYTYLDIESFKLLFKSLVRPHLEYGAPIRNPQLKRDITDLENVHKRVTRQIPALKGMSYQERLRRKRLPTLRYRRLRGDMIEAYKLLHNVYDPTLPSLSRVTFEIWWMTLKNNRAHLLCYFNRCVSFQSHRWIRTKVTVRKRSI